MRKGWLVILSLLLVGAITSVALAASPHFTRNGAPECRDTGVELVCTGELAGLGNGDLLIELESSAEASFACGNPGRKSNQAPGINKVPFEASGDQLVDDDAFKNGRARFEVVAPEDPPPTPDSEDICPNGNWETVTLSGIDFEDITLTISQGGVTLFTCTFTGEVPTDGTVVRPTCQSG